MVLNNYIWLFKGYTKKVTTLALRPPSPRARATPHLLRNFQLLQCVDMSRPSSPSPSETEAREEALRSRERRDVLGIFDDRAMDFDDDPRFLEDFHGFENDPSPRRGGCYRGRSNSRSKSRDRYPFPFSSVESPVESP